MTLTESWRAYMSVLHDRALVTAAAVRPPRSRADRASAEHAKVPWTQELREFYALHDGQAQAVTTGPDVGTVLPELWLLGVEDVVEEHRRCRESLHHIAHLGPDWPSVARVQPAGVVVSMFRDSYVPFATTGDGNYLCIDTGPGQLHGCVREYSVEFADEGGPLFPSLADYIDSIRLSVEAMSGDPTSAPRVDAGVLRWDVPRTPEPEPEPTGPEPKPLYIPFPLIEFLPSEVAPDDDLVDLDVIAEKVLETARSLHPNAEIEGGRCVFPRVPRIQGATMNSFVRVDGEPRVYFTVVTGVDDEVLIHEIPTEGFRPVDERGVPVVRDDDEHVPPALPVTFTRASFDRRNAPLRTSPPVGPPRPPVPDLHVYDWAADHELNRYMFDAYCLTIVTDVTIDEFLELVPTPNVIDQCDFETLYDRGMDIFRERTPGGAQGLFEHGGAVVMFESNGFHGVSHRLMSPISVGRTVASHHQGGNNGGLIHWYSDGGLRTAFGLSDATGREGEHPDQLVPLMRAIGGFRLDYDEDEEYVWMDLPYMQAAFALAEALTGVRLTMDLLRDSTYLSLDIPIPD